MVRTPASRLGAAVLVLGLGAGTAPLAAADPGATEDTAPSKASAARSEDGARRAPRPESSASRSRAVPVASAIVSDRANRTGAAGAAPRRNRGGTAHSSRHPLPRAEQTVGGEPRDVAATAPQSPVSVTAAPAETPSATPAPPGIEPAPPAPTRAVTAVAAVPTGAAANSTADWFTGLFAPIRSFLEGVGLLIRRTFFNQAPTLNPVQLTGQTVGSITGTLNASDPEGDPLTFSVTEFPQFGSVNITADGSYVYTPGPDFDGRDAFNVAVSDRGGFNLLDPGRPPATEAYVQVAQSAVAAMLTFSFLYGSGSQYWSAAARSALESSAALLATYLVVTSPTTVTFTVTGENSPTSSTLASAGSNLSGPGSGFFTTVVQEKIQTGVDTNGSEPDGDIDWNFGNPWAFGAGVTTAQYDFTSTAIHELMHTIGFLSYTEGAGANTGRSWTVFDRYLVDSGGTRAISDSYRWNSAFNANLTGGNGGLYFGGPTAVAVNGGYVPLYTPDPWEPGSSMSHLDDTTFTGAQMMLMTAVTDTGRGVRELSQVELAILADLGYTVNGLNTSPVSLLAFALVGFGLRRRRAALSAR